MKRLGIAALIDISFIRVPNNERINKYLLWLIISMSVSSLLEEGEGMLAISFRSLSPPRMDWDCRMDGLMSLMELIGNSLGLVRYSEGE